MRVDPEFERWRAEADGALASAHLQRSGRLHNWACFSAEQAAQLGLMALLHGLGRGPWEGTTLSRSAEAWPHLTSTFRRRWRMRWRS